MPHAPTLRLCTDERTLAEGTGVSTYARALAAAQRRLDSHSLTVGSSGSMSRLRRLASAFNVTPLKTKPVGDDRFVAADLFRRAQVRFDVQGRLTDVRLPQPAGIMHWSYPLPLRAVGWRNIYTVHDLIPLLRPDLTPISRDRHLRLLRKIFRAADLIVTVSETSRRDILASFDCSPDRVVNCGVAIVPGRSADRLPSGLESGKYLLVLGSVEPRKNIRRIIEAFGDRHPEYRLVIAGPSGWQADTISDAIATSSNIVRLPWLSEESRNAVLTHARAILMPSLAEGFGLPVIEAMSMGIPVLCSFTGALAETAGDAALTVEPTDVEALTTAIDRIIIDETLRDCLISAGRNNALRFTADRLVTALSNAYGILDVPTASRSPFAADL